MFNFHGCDNTISPMLCIHLESQMQWNGFDWSYDFNVPYQFFTLSNIDKSCINLSKIINNAHKLNHL